MYKRQRFDRRYVFYAHRNSVVLLARVYGTRSATLGRYVATSLRETFAEVRRALSGVKHIRRLGVRKGLRTFAGGLATAGAIKVGLIAGWSACLLYTSQGSMTPSRVPRLNAYVLAADPW